VQLLLRNHFIGATNARVLQIAMQHAVGLNGVAVISLSGDVAMQNIEHDELEHPLFLNYPNICPCEPIYSNWLRSSINQKK